MIRKIPFCLMLVSVGSLLFPSRGISRALGIDDKDPYSMTLVASQGPSTTDVTVTIISKDPRKYPIPTSLKKLLADLKVDHGSDIEKYNVSDVPLVNGQTTFSIQGLQPGKTIAVEVHFKPQGGDEEDLKDDVTIPLGPDLLVQKVNAPEKTDVNAPFDVEAVIKESNGKTGASATIALYEGTTVLGSFSSVTVPKGSNVTVVFHGMKASTPGTHTYTVKISGANPGESDLSDNEYSFTISAIQKPDLRVANIVAPQQVFVNTPFDVQATIKEFSGQIGASAVATLYDDRTILGTLQNVVVPAGGSVSVLFKGITAPTSGPDKYTVKISGSNPSESDVTNNTSSFSITAVLRPDLRFQKVDAPKQVTVNAPFNIEAVISESDGKTGATAVVTLYEGTTVLGMQSNVVVPRGSNVSVSFQALRATTPGTHAYTVKISGADPGESDLSDNEYSFTISAILKPDLRVASVVAPQQVFVKTPFDVQATIQEFSGQTGATAVVTLCDGPTVLGTLRSVAVPQGGTVTVLFQGITAPTSGPDTYTIKISSSNPDETDVTNNAYTFSITAVLRPDLRVDKVVAPEKVSVNVPFNVEAFIQEARGQSGATATVTLYEGTTALGSSANVVVPKGSTVSVLFQGIIAATPGTHSYKVKISNSDPPEASDSKDDLSFSISAILRPDLRIEKLVLPAQVFVSTPFNVEADVREYGGLIGATATVKLYDGTTALGTFRNVVVAKGTSVSVTFQNLNLLVLGAHSFAVKISNSDPDESDETNNDSSFTVTAVLRPDLRVDNVIAPSQVDVGVPFSVQAVIREFNRQSSTTAVVSLSEGARVLGTFSNVVVAPGGSTSVVFQGITAPTAGVHNYSIKISNANPAESDISNNNSTFSVTASVRPDLHIDAIAAPLQVAVNTPFDVQAVIREVRGQIGSTAVVTLFEGVSVLGSIPNVSVPQRGSTSVVFHNVTETLSGIHTYTLKISGSSIPEFDVTNNDSSFSVSVVATPDLSVDRVVAPTQVTLDSPFNVQVTVRELNGQTADTAVVTLYDGTTALSTISGVVIPKGDSVIVVFQGIHETTSGARTLTARVSNARPGESNLGNNEYSINISVIQQVPMHFGLSYAYQSQSSWTRNSGRYISLDSTITESASLDFSATVTAQTPLSSTINGITWKIETPRGTFNQSTFTGLARTAGDQNTDVYSLTDVNNKNISFTLTVDRSTGSIQVSMHQQSGFSDHILVTPDVSLEIPAGDPASVLLPASTLSVTLQLQGGDNNWGGTATITIPPPSMYDSSKTIRISGSSEDGTFLVTETGFAKFQTSGPSSGSATSRPQVKPMVEDDNVSGSSLPTVYSLAQNYPNPFNPSTTIEFALPNAGYVTLKVYDILAREVATLVSKDYLAGVHRVQWNANGLPSGMYVYQLRAGDFVSQKKVVLLK